MSARADELQLGHAALQNVTWLTPQQLDAIRLEYAIGDMVAGRRPVCRPFHDEQTDAHRRKTPSIL